MPNRKLPFSRLLRFAFAIGLITVLAVHVSPVNGRGTFETADFTVRWSDRWQVANQSNTNLVLEDGLTYVHMVGIFDNADPAVALPGIVENWFSLYPGEEVTEVTATNNGERASTIYTYLYRSPNDELIPYAVYLEARQIAPGLLLWIIIDTQWGLYNSDPGIYGAVLDSLEIAGAATNGESHPTFVAANWRVGVANASLSPEFIQLGLQATTDQNWIVVILDITNWSDAAKPFAAEELTVLADGIAVQQSPLHALMVSRSLGLDETSTGASAIAASGTIRTAFAFLIPDSAVELSLELAGQGLPLGSLLSTKFTSADLAPNTRLPDFTSGTLVGLLGGSSVVVRTESGDEEIILLGSSISNRDECYFRESTTAAFSYMGKPVLLETDPSVLGNGFRYIWVTDEAGNRVLLNQELIENGSARVIALPDSSRFGLWMSTAESIAQQDARGLWESCGGPIAP